MRRLGVFVISLLLLSGIFLSSSSSVFAQNTNNTVSVAQLIQHANDYLFQQTLTALNNERAAINSNRTAPDYQTKLQANTAALNATRAAKTAFENYLASNQDGTDTRQIYSTALGEAKTSLIASQQANSSLQTGTGKTFVDNFIQQIGTEQTNTEWIPAIASGIVLSTQAQQQGNAVRAAANPSNVNNQPPKDECGIWKGSITNCIDTGIAWIIKNTLLQIAGFLVWVTANILNYAIEISILNFSQWAPSGLYAIWQVIRQIISLAVVFAGLYLGFMYIIGKEDTFTKYIGWLVIFALFVNFSYPVARTLTDISNIVSLNIYSSAVGADVLTPNSNNTPGALIMNKLGLYGLVGSATDVKGGQAGFIQGLNSTPAALLAVAFVLYTAYVFFRASMLMVGRLAALVFIIIASPLLLIDSVVPKLGEAAMKIRKIFFEQLLVAPVFMLMLALTLKFIEVFKIATDATAQTALSAASNGNAIVTFFNMIMMLIMLHYTLKITTYFSGEVGQYASNALGKVGGFGLAAATAGTGFLARGTIGAAASRMRDSGWMDKMQGSRMGRGLYTLSNSLAQSSFDARNVGLVSKGLATAGLTGAMGMSMQQGSKNNYDQSFAAKKERVTKKYNSINNAEARQAYYDQVQNGPISRFTGGRKIAPGLDLAEIDLKKKEEGTMDEFIRGDDAKRKQMILQAKESKNQDLVGKLEKGAKYFENKAIKPDGMSKLENEEVTLRKDLEKDTEHYKLRSKEFAEKELEFKQEDEQLDSIQKTITLQEQEIAEKEEQLSRDEKNPALKDKVAGRRAELERTKRDVATKRAEFGTRKQAQESKGYELQQMQQENKILGQNLELQKAHYQEKKNLLESTRKEFISSTAKNKASALDGLDSKNAIDIIDKDQFTEHQKDNLKEIDQLQKEMQGLEKGDAKYDQIREQLNEKRAANQKMVDDLRKAIKNEYFNKNYTNPNVEHVDIPVGGQQNTRIINETRPFTREETEFYDRPAYQRETTTRASSQYGTPASVETPAYMRNQQAQQQRNGPDTEHIDIPVNQPNPRTPAGAQARPTPPISSATEARSSTPQEINNFRVGVTSAVEFARARRRPASNQTPYASQTGGAQTV